jgi:hypothetical protein
MFDHYVFNDCIVDSNGNGNDNGNDNHNDNHNDNDNITIVLLDLLIHLIKTSRYVAVNSNIQTIVEKYVVPLTAHYNVDVTVLALQCINKLWCYATNLQCLNSVVNVVSAWEGKGDTGNDCCAVYGNVLECINTFLNAVHVFNRGEEGCEIVVSKDDESVILYSSIAIGNLCNNFIKRYSKCISDRYYYNTVVNHAVQCIFKYVQSSTPTFVNTHIPDSIDTRNFVSVIDVGDLQTLVKDVVMSDMFGDVVVKGLKYGGKEGALLCTVLKSVVSLFDPNEHAGRTILHRIDHLLHDNIATYDMNDSRDSVMWKDSEEGNDILYNVVLYAITHDCILKSLVQGLSLKLMTVLQAGSEAYMAFLLSEKELLPDFLNKFFIGLLLNTKRRVAQVAHSSKFKKMTSKTSLAGPFSLTTLNPTISVAEKEDDTSLLLPLGNDVVLHVLSSIVMSVGVGNGVNVDAPVEDKNVDENAIRIGLQLLTFLREQQTSNGWYWKSLDVSEIIYHITLCAQCVIVKDDSIDELVHSILFTIDSESDGVVAKKFIESVIKHDALKNDEKNDGKNDDDNDNNGIEESNGLVTGPGSTETYDPESDRTHTYNYTSEQVRTYKTYLFDYINTYTSTFLNTKKSTKYLLRLLMRDGFPTDGVKEGYEKLKGCFRSLSCARGDNDEGLVELRKCLSAGKIAPKVMDCYVDILRDDVYVINRSNSWYFYTLCVTNLAYQYRRSGGGDAAKHRISRCGKMEDVMSLVEIMEKEKTWVEGEEESVDFIVSAVNKWDVGVK